MNHAYIGAKIDIFKGDDRERIHANGHKTNVPLDEELNLIFVRRARKRHTAALIQDAIDDKRLCLIRVDLQEGLNAFSHGPTLSHDGSIVSNRWLE